VTIPIRPTNLPAANPAAAPSRSDAARQAQRAFFQSAMKGSAPSGAAQAPAAPAQPPAVFAQPVQRLPDPKAEAPTKILRPGSLLDIRV
jgi:hypothetical protein